MHILASLNSQSHLQDTEKGSQVIIWITEKECFVNFTLSYHECSQVWLREGNIIKEFIVFNAILHHSLSFCNCPVFRRRVYTCMFVLPKGNLYNIHIWWVFSSVQFSSVQSISRVWLFVTPLIAACQASLSITSSQSLLKLMSIESVGDAIQSSHPLSSTSPAFNLCQQQCLFKWVSSSHQVAKVLEFQLQHQSLQWTPRTDLL